MNTLKSSLLGAAIGLGLAGNASAVLLAYEGFDYTVGENFSGKSGGTGWVTASSWDASNSFRMKINNGGLSYLGLSVAGNALNNSTTSSVRAQRSFANAPTSGSVFFSFLVNGDENTTGRYGANLRPADDTSGPGAVGQSGSQSLNGTAGFDFRADQTELGFNGSNIGGTSIDGTNLLVVQYNYDTNEANYWANPTSLGGAAPAATVSGIGFTDPTKTIEEFFFGYQDTNSTSAIFDELRVGTTFASVTPVPEPSAAVLMGLGAALVGFRRNRKA